MKQLNEIDTGSMVVTRGQNGTLYLTGGAHEVLEYVTGVRPLNPRSLIHFSKNLISRKAAADSMGIPYCHIVCPDKHSVLREDFPHDIVETLGDRFQRESGVPFLYPVDALRDIPGGGSYWKTDTHWTVQGQLVAVRTVMRELGFESAHIEDRLDAVLAACTTRMNYTGDLGVKLDPRPVESGLVYERPHHMHFSTNGLVGNNGTINVIHNPRADRGRLLVFGDSFVMSCLDVFAEFFQMVLLVRSPYFHPEIMHMFEPTHMVSANAERYLSGVPIDAGAPVALLMAPMSGKDSKPTVGFYETLNAALRPASPLSPVYFERLGQAS